MASGVMRAGDVPDVASATQARYRRPDRLRVGDVAPDFELERLETPGASGEAEGTGSGGAGRVRLSAFRGDRPVLLFFGSYT